MVYKSLLFIFLFQINNLAGQEYKEIYFPGVENVEVLTLDFWIENGGKISDVRRNPEKSTYDNLELIRNLTTTLESDSLREYKGEKIRMNYVIKLINPKYQHSKLTDKECEKLSFLKNGKFIYMDPNFKGIVVERNNETQTETYPNFVIESQINWLSNCEFNLFNIKTGNNSGFKKSDIVYVKIIGIINNATVVYRSILNGDIITGVMKKL